MTTPLPLSVFIIAKNEEDRIPYTIQSVIGWADEVIVIDSGSTDKTIRVSQDLGARVIYNEWKGYGPQKVFGEGLCRNDWILNIDADEEISPALAEEIQQLFQQGEPPREAYHIIIKLMTRYGTYPRLFTPSNDPIRLYNKKYAGFKDSTVHDSVVLRNPDQGRIGKLRNIILHRCFRSLSHAVEKINFYSTLQAENMISNGRIPTAGRVVVEPIAAFTKAYFIRRYFIYGVDGIVESLVYSFARTLRLAKARELAKEREKQEN